MSNLNKITVYMVKSNKSNSKILFWWDTLLSWLAKLNFTAQDKRRDHKEI